MRVRDTHVGGAPIVAGLVMVLASAIVSAAVGDFGWGGRAPRAEARSGETSFRFERLGQSGGAARAVAADDRHAYLGVGPRIVVVDVDTAGNPTFVAQSDVLPGVVQDVAVTRDHVFAAYASGIPYDRTGGLAVLNVAAPARPQLLGVLPITSTIEGVAVSADIVCLVGSRVHRPPTATYAEWTGVMHVVDVSDRHRPRLTASIPFEHRGRTYGVIAAPFRGGAHGVTMHGESAYVSASRYDASTSLRVVDLTDPERPFVRTSTVLPGKPEGVVGGRDHIYVSGGPQGLRVLSADPADLDEVGRLPMTRDASCFGDSALHGDFLAVIDPCGKRLRVVSVADPERPIERGEWPLADAGVKAAWMAGRVLVPGGASGGLFVLGLDGDGHPRPVGDLALPGAARRVAVLGDEAYVTHPEVGLSVIPGLATQSGGPSDWRAPRHAVVDLPDPRDVLAAADRGGALYVAGGEAGVVHVFAPTDGGLARRDDVPAGSGADTVADLELGAGRLFAGIGPSSGPAVRAFDRSQPLAPREVASGGVHDEARDIAFSDGHLYSIGGLSWMFAFDGTATGVLPEVGKVSADYHNRLSRTITAGGGYVYRAGEGWSSPAGWQPGSGRSSGLAVFDARDPAALRAVVEHEDIFGSAPGRMRVDGTRLYISSSRGLTIVSAPPLDRVEVLATWDSPGAASDVVVVHAGPSGGNDLAYVADGDGGVQALRLVDASVPTPTPSSTPPPAATRNAPVATATPLPPVVLAESVFLPFVVRGAGTPPRPLDITYVAETGGPGPGIDVVGDLVYRGEGAHLVVLDASDPTDVREIARSELLPDLVVDVDVLGDHAFVAAGNSGFVVLDLAPERPAIVARMRMPDTLLDILVIDAETALVAAGDAGLLALDIRDPSRPIEVGRASLPGTTRRVAASGGYAYTAGGEPHGVHVVDVRDPAAPTVVSHLGVGDEWRGADTVAVADGFAYVGSCHDLLTIFDVARPETPSLVYRQDLADGGICDAMAVDGDTLYASGDGSITAIDVSDRTRPTVRSRVVQMEGRQRTYDFGIGGDRVYASQLMSMGGWDPYFGTILGELLVLDASDPASLRQVGTFWHAEGIADETHLVGHHLYARLRWLPNVEPDRGQRIVVTDIADPFAPRPLGFLDDPAYVTALAVDGVTGYAVAGSEESALVVLDLSDPLHPRRYGSVTLGTSRPWASAIAVEGRHAYAAVTERRGDATALHVVDVGDPARPRLVGHLALAGLQLPDGHPRIAAHTGLVAIAGVGSGICVVDARQPQAPRLAATHGFGDHRVPQAVTSWRDTLAVAVLGSGVHLLDLQDPSEPREVSVIVGSVPGSRPWGLAYGDGFLFVAGDGGMSAHDVTDARHPLQVDALASPSYVPHPNVTMRSVTLSRDAAYAPYAAGDYEHAGIAVLRIRRGVGADAERD